MKLACKECGREDLQLSLKRFMNKNNRLKELLEERRNPASAREAQKIIDQAIPLAQQSQIELEIEQSISNDATIEDDLFTFHGQKAAVAKLDWSVSPRMTRDGSGEIKLHNKKEPDENTKYLTFLLCDKVLMGHDSMPLKLRKEVLELAATIVMYDSGHKQVKGISNLQKTWHKRLVHYFITGANTHPFKNNRKGRTKYTDAVDFEHPGLIQRLFRYAEEQVGHQDTFENMANQQHQNQGQVLPNIMHAVVEMVCAKQRTRDSSNNKALPYCRPKESKEGMVHEN